MTSDQIVISKSPLHRYCYPIILILVVVILDQSSKEFVRQFLLPSPQTNFDINHEQTLEHYLTSFLNLVYLYNYGISFGIMNNPTQNQYLWISISCIIIILLSLSLKQECDLYLALIIGGAIGNVIDRILYGAVFDFIDFHWKSWHFPAFNIADSAIVLGVGIVILKELNLNLFKKPPQNG